MERATCHVLQLRVDCKGVPPQFKLPRHAFNFPPSVCERVCRTNGLEFHPFPRTFQVSSLSASLEGGETTVEVRGRGDSSILWLSWHSSSALTGYLFKLRLFNRAATRYLDRREDTRGSSHFKLTRINFTNWSSRLRKEWEINWPSVG